MKYSMNWLVLQEGSVEYNDKNFSKNWGWYPGQYRQIYYKALQERKDAGERCKRQKVGYYFTQDND